MQATALHTHSLEVLSSEYHLKTKQHSLAAVWLCFMLESMCGLDRQYSIVPMGLLLYLR